LYKFAIIGVAGYIAPRHLEAIRETGNLCVAAMDIHDSVGILDQYFPDCHFFTEIERFDRHLDKLRRAGEGIDFLVVCTPNYLHDAHIRLGLRNGAHVICEKPLVINPWNLDALDVIEKETGKNVYGIMQLRYHPEVIELRNKVFASRSGKKSEVELIYHTPRGLWYEYSWKGNSEKSGGVAMNIGIHFFDLLQWIFGEVENISLKKSELRHISGNFQMVNADVHWDLSIDQGPKKRMLSIDGQQIVLDQDFERLHILSYKDILEGGGLRIKDVRKSIELVQSVNKMIL
jgi:UDP-N-acetyl-2-amino-2-deoxyglucuronate dehydrogenase